MFCLFYSLKEVNLVFFSFYFLKLSCIYFFLINKIEIYLGFFPLVLLQPWAKKVKLEMCSSISADDVIKLTKFYNAKLDLHLKSTIKI